LRRDFLPGHARAAAADSENPARAHCARSRSAAPRCARAEVIALPEVHLGERLDVQWRLDHGGREVTDRPGHRELRK